MITIIIALAIFLRSLELADKRLKQAEKQAQQIDRQAGRQAKNLPAMPKQKPVIDHTEQIEALQMQLDAICEHALALDKAADAQKDPIKKASYASRSAGTYARAAGIQAKIDKLTAM